MISKNKEPIPFDKSFASHPRAKNWSVKNVNNPSDYAISSGKKAWFLCPDCGHVFDKRIGDIYRGSWCPYCCVGPRILCSDILCEKCSKLSFASHEKAQYWSIKNIGKPSDYTISSGKKAWFLCPDCNHEFEKQIAGISAGSFCPYCSIGGKICDNNSCNKCYKSSFASHEKAKYWSTKNNKTSRQYSISSSQKVYFTCSKCNHDYKSMISNVSRGTGCPYCGKSQKIVCDKIDCIKCYEASFVSHPKAIYWSIENRIKPREALKGTSEKFKFDCDKCNHVFEMGLCYIVDRDQWCNYCASKLLCEYGLCTICYNKSFASHPKAKCWSSKNGKTARQVFKGSSNKYWLICDVCNHEFSNCMDYLTMQGGWCHYCSHDKLCESETCQMCYDNSLAGNSMAQYWSAKNKVTPRMIFRHGTTEKFIFDCPYCKNEYLAIASIISMGHWCDCMLNKTEYKLHEYLKKQYPFAGIEKQKKFSWCKRHNYLPFDFCLEDYKLIIELDGAQHFEKVSNWKLPEITQKDDKYKMVQAKNHGYAIIRILQDDVWRDINKWKDKLNDAIFQISQNIGNCMVIFIGERYKTDYFAIDDGFYN